MSPSQQVDLDQLLNPAGWGIALLAVRDVLDGDDGWPTPLNGHRSAHALNGDPLAARKLLHAPVVNLMVTGIINLMAIFLDVVTSTSFINFGAFTW